jgi:hypothetical protein
MFGNNKEIVRRLDRIEKDVREATATLKEILAALQARQSVAALKFKLGVAEKQ